MTNWKKWGREAFTHSGKTGKPILLWLVSGEQTKPLPEALESAIGADFVGVRMDALDRPDVMRRCRDGENDLAALSSEGRVIGSAASSNPDAAAGILRKIAEGHPDVKAHHHAGPAGPVWTGAVGEESGRPLDPDAPRKALEELKTRLPAALCDFDSMDLLVYAAGEWKDEESLKIIRGELERVVRAELASPVVKGGSPLKKVALWTRLAWDAYAVTELPNLKRLGLDLADSLSRSFFDEKAGAFRSFEDSGKIYSLENAMAAIALLRSYAFTEDPLQRTMAEKTLAYLSGAAFDAHKGIFHFKAAEAGESVWGLLDDNAWTALAFGKAFLMTGHKPYREFADTVVRHMFQELWERERGGFTDRTPAPDDPAILKEKVAPADLNAAAFEAVWRVHQLKGNQSYRKWLDWGFKSLAQSASGRSSVALAKIQDILALGRTDLELVGVLDEAKTQALLAAIFRLYIPRKIISFVDPNDKDYTMAHKLEAAAYPRLFACKDLKRVADTDDPEKVARLLEKLG